MKNDLQQNLNYSNRLYSEGKLRVHIIMHNNIVTLIVDILVLFHIHLRTKLKIWRYVRSEKGRSCWK